MRSVSFEKNGSSLVNGCPAVSSTADDAVFFCQAEKLRHEIELQDGFTAADRDAALFAPVAFVAERPLIRQRGSFSL